MGAIYSIQKEIFEESSGDEESTEPSSTEPLPYKRLLTLDPRSPSEGIYRTPIIVDKTPNPAESKIKQAVISDETPKAVPSIKDPRSPTCEFTRTPMNPCCSSAMAQLDTPVTSRQASALDISPAYSPVCGSESGIESAEVSPAHVNNCQITGQSSLDSPDSALSVGMDHQTVICTENIVEQSSSDIRNQVSHKYDAIDMHPMCDDVSDDDDDDSMDVEDVTSVGIENISLSTQVVKYQNTPVLQNVIRSRSQAVIGMKPKALSLTPGVTRSPLSLVENSSRALAQRNHMTTQAVKPHLAPNARAADKENIFH